MSSFFISTTFIEIQDVISSLVTQYPEERVNTSTEKKDVITFCTFLTDTAIKSHVVATNHGLQNNENLEACLQRCDYIPVLKAIWSEKDLAKRVEWLRAHSHVHAPLIYELALAEFEANPTIETLKTKSFPMLIFASLRVEQDRRCVDDSALEAAWMSLFNTYHSVLHKKIHEKLDVCPHDYLLQQERDTLKATYQTTLPFLLKLASCFPLPSPTYLGPSSAKALNGQRVNILPAELAYKKQQEFARNLSPD